MPDFVSRKPYTPRIDEFMIVNIVPIASMHYRFLQSISGYRGLVEFTVGARFYN